MNIQLTHELRKHIKAERSRIKKERVRKARTSSARPPGWQISEYLGVSWVHNRNKWKSSVPGKWCASIKVDGNRRFLGYFDDPIEAAKCRDKALVDLGKTKGTMLNFPEDFNESDVPNK